MELDIVSMLLGQSIGGGGGGSDVPWNENFAVNWDFRNPRNTRGETIYSGSGNVFTLDGWRLQGGSLTVETGGIRLARYSSETPGYLEQIFSTEWTAAFVGIPMTLSAVVDGTLGMFNVTMTSGAGNKGPGMTVSGIPIRLYNYYGQALAITFDIGASAQDHLISGIKLEVGSVSTLASGDPAMFHKAANTAEETIKVTSEMVTNA